MEQFLKILALALVTVLAILLLRKRTTEFALVLSLVCISALCFYAATTLQPVMDMLERLETLSGVHGAVLAPVVKTALIGILTHICAGICSDAGESGISRMVELCGTAMALYLSTPLITAVLDLLDTLLGGAAP